MTPPPPQLNLDGFNMELGPSEKIEYEPVKRKLTREEKKEEKNFVDTIVYGLSAPLIFGPGGWGETYPEEMRSLGRIMRLAQSIEIHDSKMSNYFDAHAYLYSLSMVAPMSHSWNKIFFFCFSQAHKEKWKILLKDPMFTKMDIDLEQNEVYDLNRLRSWIYKNQMEAVKRHG